MSDKTLGEKRVRTDFNASGSSEVDEIKKDFADIINKLEHIRVNSTHLSDAELSEKFRLVATAQTKVEEAAMWAVKAVTV